MHNETILITGADGFIGRTMIRRFQNEYARIHALILPGHPVPDEWGERVTIFEGDVTKPETLIAPSEGVGKIFHHAALVTDWGPNDLFHKVDVQGTEHIIHQALRQDAHLLLTSSIAVHGADLGKGDRREDMPHGKPLGVYSRNKMAQEMTARKAAADRGLKLTVIRPANVVGPASGPWVHGVIDQLRKGRPALIDGGDFPSAAVHVENVVELFALAAQNPKALGGIYHAVDHLGDVTWREYLQLLATEAGCKPPKALSGSLAKLFATASESLWRVLRLKSRPPLTHEALNLVSRATHINGTRAQEDLNYKPILNREAALKSITDYIREVGNQMPGYP